MAKAEEPGKEEKTVVVIINDSKQFSMFEEGDEGKARFHDILLQHIPDKTRTWTTSVVIKRKDPDESFGVVMSYDFTHPIPERWMNEFGPQLIHVVPSFRFFLESLAVFNEFNSRMSRDGFRPGWSVNNIVSMKLTIAHRATQR